VPADINMHSVKNRFLMRIKNVTPGLYRRFWLPMTARDLVVFFGALLWEPASIAAFWHIARCLPRTLRRRREIMTRRRVSDEALAEWFSFEPAAFSLGETSGHPTTAVRQPAIHPAPDYVVERTA
jgi:hypothetical protein